MQHPPPHPMKQQVEDAAAIFRAGVRGVQADRMMAAVDWPRWTRRSLEAYRRVVAVGMGKASMAMAGALEHQLGDRLGGGVVVVPKGYSKTLPEGHHAPQRIEVLEGAHPVPDGSSVRAARRILEVAAGLGEEDLLLVLLSGGGTSLCADFVPTLTLEDAQATFRLLLEGGADIHAMNTVRKHLSRVGGGQLAQAAAPAEVLALVVSDVVGDDLSVIASGPTVPDPSTFEEAVEVLRRHRLWAQVPEAVRRHLEEGLRAPRRETPKPGSPLFEAVRTELIGSSREALAAARAEAVRRGYGAYLLSRQVTGEARVVGRRLAEEACGVQGGTPVCLLWGGETTVTVRGNGRGGRNQELTLAAAIALEGERRPIVLLSGGTDGRDGPMPVAGAWATPDTAREARARGIMPEYYLSRNDAYSFFEQVGGLLRTGPTHTNVMDLQIALIRPIGV